MDTQKTRQLGLLFVLVLNIVSTIFHYTDNALFVDQYSGPEGLTTAEVLGAWLLMTPFGLLGYWLYIKGFFWAAYLCLSFYSLTGISSWAHYLYPIEIPMSLKMHLLIWSDGIVGLSLICFILWSGLLLREWRRV